MTATQKKRLAKETRRLAYECANGTAPRFGTDFEFQRNGSPVCVLGHIQSRAGLGPSHEYSAFGAISFPYPERVPVVIANDDLRGQHDVLVFPLLALADALEAQL